MTKAMQTITQAQVEQALAKFQDPYLAKDWQSLGFVKRINLASQLELSIVLPYPAAGIKQSLIHKLQQHLTQSLSIQNCLIELSWQINAYAVQVGMQTMPGIKNIIAVASGKGGVGKSTSAVNLSLALLAEGARVGLLDADIYGPSQPMMLGVAQRPTATEHNTMLPIMAYGLQTMSIGYLIDEATPMVWRGPMVSGALQQLLNQTQWQDLDYLIVDLPPGTGDIQLSLAQKIPVSGAIIVTTPQDIALLDVRKATAMFQKVKVPVLGVVENMSLHTCSQCGHQEAIFGQGGGQLLATEYEVPLLGQLPLDKVIREQADQGKPLVVAEPESSVTLLYREIARNMVARLCLQTKTHKFPKIVIETRS
jgi:ATP-binding protein involved in chromosome partitioning